MYKRQPLFPAILLPMAGSLVGAGIGNKIAGNKGALIGGFVGGMVNPNIRFGKSSSTRHQKYGSLNDINIHSKMNFDNYNQIMNKIKEEENLYRLYLQNKTVADRINKVAPSYSCLLYTSYISLFLL